MSRDDALKLVDVMLNVADVNVISNNISTAPQHSPQEIPLHSQLQNLPMPSQTAVQHPSVEGLRHGHRSLPSEKVQTHESTSDAVVDVYQHQSAKQWFRSLWQERLVSDVLSAHEPAVFVSTGDNCAPAVASATVLNITAAEQPATLLVKPPELHMDIWDQIVAPAMSCGGLLVESWLHSTSRLASTCCRDHCTVDAAGVQFAGKRWTVMQDHAKWGVCCDKVVVCFGDMNRVYSQRVRGGMALCMVADDSSGPSLPAQLYAHLLPALRTGRNMCFWQRKEQCPCKGMQQTT